MRVQIRQENELTSGSTQESEWRKFRFVFFSLFLLFLHTYFDSYRKDHITYLIR